MTLLELLAALCVFGVFIIAIGSWLISSAKVQAAIESSFSDRSLLRRTAEAIRQDLEQSPRSFTSNHCIRFDYEKNQISCLTSHGAGEPAAHRRVVWWFDEPRQTIVRQSNPLYGDEFSNTRDALCGVSRFKVCQIQDTQAVNQSVFTEIHIVRGNLDQTLLWRPAP